MTEPFFFPARDGTPLFGVWRAPSTAAPSARCWVVCPPFAEEEKSAHRTLVELCEALREQGASTLCLAYRGTGDSGADFSQSTLSAWREDIQAAFEEAARRSKSTPGLIGLRLGASLALQVAKDCGTHNLILLEPTLNGRSYLMQLGARKKLRAAMTEHEAGEAQAQSGEAQTLTGEPSTPPPGIPEPADSQALDDLDGWPLSAALREELRALDLMREVPPMAEPSRVLVLQVGPRAQIAPPLQKFEQEIKAKNQSSEIAARAVVMPPFWNRLDLVESTPLADEICAFQALDTPVRENAHALPRATGTVCARDEKPVLFQNARGENITGVFHESKSTIGAPSESNPQAAILMLHGWTGYRTGPHQMLTRGARLLAAQGFPVLRFDFAGRGDSDGLAPHATLATMTDDARAALRWLADQHGKTRFILLGLCSGCEIALATAAHEADKIESLVLWSAPVFAAGQSSERIRKKRVGHLKDYARKLLQPETWAKAVSGKVDVRGVSKVLRQGGGQESKNRETGETGQLPHGWREDVLIKFKKFERPVFMVYGTADPTTEEALQWHREVLAARAGALAPAVHLVEGANHSYYGLNWEDEVFAATQKWLVES